MIKKILLTLGKMGKMGEMGKKNRFLVPLVSLVVSFAFISQVRSSLNKYLITFGNVK